MGLPRSERPFTKRRSLLLMEQRPSLDLFLLCASALSKYEARRRAPTPKHEGSQKRDGLSLKCPELGLPSKSYEEEITSGGSSTTASNPPSSSHSATPPLHLRTQAGPNHAAHSTQEQHGREFQPAAGLCLERVLQGKQDGGERGRALCLGRVHFLYLMPSHTLSSVFPACCF